MLALYILGGILAFLFVLLLIPVWAQVSFSEAFQLTIGYGPLRIPIPLEGEEGEEGPQPQEEPAPPEKKKGPSRLKRALKREGFWGFLQSLADFVGAAARAAGKLLGHFKLKHFDLYLCLAGGWPLRAVEHRGLWGLWAVVFPHALHNEGRYGRLGLQRRREQGVF